MDIKSFLVLIVNLSMTLSEAEMIKNRPNIILIVVDDLGIGDLGCFGNTTIDTPNIDSLCETGARLTHHVTPAVLCTPSRAALLTGRYAARMGLTGEEDTPPVIIYAAARAGLPDNETTVAEVAARSGYRTAAVGKWHLGLNADTWGDQRHGPLGHGFQYFYGLPHTLVDGFEKEENFFTLKECFQETELPIILFCLIPLRFVVGRKTFFSLIFLIMFVSWFFLEHFRMTRANWWARSDLMEKFLNSFILENNTVVEKPINLAALSAKLVDRSVAVIEASSEDPRPLLLYHSFAHVHTPLAAADQFTGASARHGVYGDVIAEVDAGVGRILRAVRDSGLEDNTLVYFTSDHGGDWPQLGDQGGYNGIYRGGKGNGALEGGMRVPGIIKWPGVVAPGSTVSEVTSLLDILPTLADIVTAGDTSGGGNKLDGESLLGILRGNKKPSERTIFHFCDSEIFALRTQFEDRGTYKLILQEPILTSRGSCEGSLCPCYGPGVRVHRPPLLYHIDTDPTESSELDPASEVYQRVVAVMRREYRQFTEDLNTSKMPSQFRTMRNVLPMPWLQPYLSV